MYFTAVYGIIRNRGNFGDVSISWVVSPDFTQDVFPVQGTVFFGDQEFFKNITIYSLPDEVSIAYIILFTCHCLIIMFYHIIKHLVIYFVVNILIKNSGTIVSDYNLNEKYYFWFPEGIFNS